MRKDDCMQVRSRGQLFSNSLGTRNHVVVKTVSVYSE